MSEDELLDYLHEHIPLSAAMGVRVVRADDDAVVLEAPLDPNLNHRSTAFGGSVSALAILAGWTRVHLRLRAEGRAGETVIQESSVRYDRPVTGSFRAHCGPLDEAAWSRLVRMVDRRGMGRIRMRVRVEAGGETTGSLEGTYVVLSGRSGRRGTSAPGAG